MFVHCGDLHKVVELAFCRQYVKGCFPHCRKRSLNMKLRAFSRNLIAVAVAVAGAGAGATALEML